MKIYQLLTIVCLATSLTNCHDGVDETVESTWMMPLVETPSYNFSRSGESSVDTWECQMMQGAASYLYDSFLQKAYAIDKDAQRRMRMAFEQGQNLAHLRDNIATTAPKEEREKILADFDGLLDDTDRLAQVHNQEAQMGQAGYIGYSRSDDSRSFANANGLIPAEMFSTMLMGGVYLDKLMSVHLTDANFANQQLRDAHRNIQLLLGKNYTQLESHWDLAYGYFTNLKPIVQSDGIFALKNREQKIKEAFAWGRYEMGKFEYDIVKEKMQFIRQDLSQIVATRAMFLLVGPNTLANIESRHPQNAFYFISQAYGLIYSLQFARNAEGKQVMTYNEVQQLLNLFTMGHGLWDIERLKANAETKGSLRNIATLIGQKYNIDLDQLIR